MIIIGPLSFKLTVDLISEATEIDNEGELWFKKSPFEFDPQRYLLPNVVPDWNKGIIIHNFKKEWIEPLRILQSYITCEGRYSLVFKYHLRFLQHMAGVSKMNLPFFFFKSLQKMSSKIKQQDDHTSPSLFHHGLIKLIISTVLQKEEKTWDFFLFWSGIHSKGEEQQPKRQTDKGRIMVQKLGYSAKPANKHGIKVKKEAKQEADEGQTDSQPQEIPQYSKVGFSLFDDKKEKEIFEKKLSSITVVQEEMKIDVKVIPVATEEVQNQPKNPITVLSDDEGYMLEDEQFIPEIKVETEIKENTTKPKSKIKKLKVIELASIQYQGKELKMMGEAASLWRPKTRSKNKLRLSMKKLLNPKLRTDNVTISDEESMEEEQSKRNEMHPVKREDFKSVKITGEESSKSIVEDNSERLLTERNKSVQVTNIPDPIIEDITEKPLTEDLMFKKFDMFWKPSKDQDAAMEKLINSDQENLKKTVKQYMHQMNYMQEVNDGLMMANRRLREDLQDTHDNFQELVMDAKEVLRRKRVADRHCSELDKKVQTLQHENEHLHKRIAELEQKHKRMKKRSSSPDGIALLVEASKEI
jgi:hypothetical protein